jgi:hypothetical protein
VRLPWETSVARPEDHAVEREEQRREDEPGDQQSLLHNVESPPEEACSRYGWPYLPGRPTCGLAGRLWDGKRRGWDLNPRTALRRSSVFKTDPFDRSGTPPSEQRSPGSGGTPGRVSKRCALPVRPRLGVKSQALSRSDVPVGWQRGSLGNAWPFRPRPGVRPQAVSRRDVPDPFGHGLGSDHKTGLGPTCCRDARRALARRRAFAARRIHAVPRGLRSSRLTPGSSP